jgi:hypothetical protein
VQADFHFGCCCREILEFQRFESVSVSRAIGYFQSFRQTLGSIAELPQLTLEAAQMCNLSVSLFRKFVHYRLQISVAIILHIFAENFNVTNAFPLAKPLHNFFPFYVLIVFSIYPILLDRSDLRYPVSRPDPSRIDDNQ